MDLYETTLAPMRQMLVNLRAWLDLAVKHAEEQQYEPDTLLTLRLFPNQFALVRQVQTACDTAKLTAQRLTGKPAPSHDDDEATVAELQGRIDATVAYLDGLSREDYAGAEDRVIELPFAKGKISLGRLYVPEFAIPNFYFHASHAYAILRHNGVPLGKLQYIGRVTMRDAQ